MLWFCSKPTSPVPRYARRYRATRAILSPWARVLLHFTQRIGSYSGHHRLCSPTPRPRQPQSYWTSVSSHTKRPLSQVSSLPFTSRALTDNPRPQIRRLSSSSPPPPETKSTANPPKPAILASGTVSTQTHISRSQLTSLNPVRSSSPAWHNVLDTSPASSPPPPRPRPLTGQRPHSHSPRRPSSNYPLPRTFTKTPCEFSSEQTITSSSSSSRTAPST